MRYGIQSTQLKQTKNYINTAILIYITTIKTSYQLYSLEDNIQATHNQTEE